MTPSPRLDPFLALLVVTAVAVAAALSPASDIVPAATAANSVTAFATATITQTAAPAAPTAPTAPTARTAWRPPVDGPPQVTRPFVAPASPYGPGHRGVDLAAPPQARVLAAAAGQVTFAGSVAGRGVVVVAHGEELRTTYEPVTAAVAAGDEVAAGQPVGFVEPGHPGCPTVACLHWGLRHGETYLDPLHLLAPPAVRLLPLE